MSCRSFSPGLNDNLCCAWMNANSLRLLQTFLPPLHCKLNYCAINVSSSSSSSWSRGISLSSFRTRFESARISACWFVLVAASLRCRMLSFEPTIYTRMEKRRRTNVHRNRHTDRQRSRQAGKQTLVHLFGEIDADRWATIFFRLRRHTSSASIVAAAAAAMLLLLLLHLRRDPWRGGGRSFLCTVGGSTFVNGGGIIMQIFD